MADFFVPFDFTVKQKRPLLYRLRFGQLKLWFLVLFCIALALNAQAQSARPALKFIDGHQLTIKGRAATIPNTGYNRIDSNLLNTLPPRVAALSKNTAGVEVNFVTNSTTISFKWILEKYGVIPNLTPIAKNGLDLYGWNKDHWQFVASVAAKGDTTEATAVMNLDGKLRAYKVYLPLYSSLTGLEVGVDASATIEPMTGKAYLSPQMSPKTKIVIYGSSITQGAAASRAGMAYPAQLARQLPAQIFNLGFSGSGKMELPVADIVGSMDADLYILDCVPNPSPAQIRARAIPFIRRLRKLRPNTPILIMESIYRETANWNSKTKTMVTDQNKAIRDAFLSLQKAGMKDIYYLPCDELTGHDHEATIDGTHLTDVGFMRLTKVLQAELRKILPKLR